MLSLLFIYSFIHQIFTTHFVALGIQYEQNRHNPPPLVEIVQTEVCISYLNLVPFEK